MQERVVLMSVKPKFVDMLLTSKKEIEVRRRRPSFTRGTRVFLYASAPVKAVMGWIFVEDIHFLPKEELWRAYGHRTGIGLKEFSSYLRGVSLACGIEMSLPRRLSTPISLDVLHQYCPGFRPPQSYLFVKHQGPLAHLLEACTASSA